MHAFIHSYDARTGITTINIKDSCFSNPMDMFLLGQYFTTTIKDHGGLVRFIINLANYNYINQVGQDTLLLIKKMVGEMHGAIIILVDVNEVCNNNFLMEHFDICTNMKGAKEFFRKSTVPPLPFSIKTAK